MKKRIGVILGGTFENIHAGHIKLVNTAFRLGSHVVIGLTSDLMAQRMRKRRVREYMLREKQLEKLINSLGADSTFEIVKIDDIYGPSIKRRDIDILLVSTETFPAALEINKKRRERGLNPLTIFVINLLETETGLKLSSSLIKERVIDEWGRKGGN